MPWVQHELVALLRAVHALSRRWLSRRHLVLQRRRREELARWIVLPRKLDLPLHRRLKLPLHLCWRLDMPQHWTRKLLNRELKLLDRLLDRRLKLLDRRQKLLLTSCAVQASQCKVVHTCVSMALATRCFHLQN